MSVRFDWIIHLYTMARGTWCTSAGRMTGSYDLASETSWKSWSRGKNLLHLLHPHLPFLRAQPLQRPEVLWVIRCQCARTNPTLRASNLPAGHHLVGLRRRKDLLLLRPKSACPGLAAIAVILSLKHHHYRSACFHHVQSLHGQRKKARCLLRLISVSPSFAEQKGVWIFHETIS